MRQMDLYEERKINGQNGHGRNGLPVACQHAMSFRDQNGKSNSTDWHATGEEKITAKRLWRKLEDQDFKCALTGLDLTPENASLDHIIPFSQGGTNTIGNVHFVVDYVNMAKGNMSYDEFISMCKSVCDHSKGSPVTPVF